MMNTDKNKNDQQKQDKKHDEKVERITQPTAKKDPESQLPRSDEHEQAGRSVGNEPRSGGRQGGKSVEDGGDDIGSSAGSR